MAYKLILLLSLSTIAAGFIGDARVARRTTNVDFSDNPAAAFRYANFPSLVGRQIHARQEDCGCQENEKCCTSPEGATFCVPESATCCGRTWCNGELETCCRDGPHGGCCPKDTMCAIGNKGCCKKDRPCFGPYICYDYSNYDEQRSVCKPGNTTVEAFQCCPQTAPWCLFDPENGYGCFIEKTLPIYSEVIVSTATDVAKAPTETPTSEAVVTPVTPIETESAGPPDTSSGGSIVTNGSFSISPSMKTGSSTLTVKTTTKQNSTQAPTTTGSIGGGAAATGDGKYAFFKQVGAAGLALFILG